MTTHTKTPAPSPTATPTRDIAYCMDALIPGFYAWWGNAVLRIGGCEAENTYPGTIHDFWGVAIVLPGYRIFTSYQGSYDPIESIHSGDGRIVITAYHPDPEL